MRLHAWAMWAVTFEGSGSHQTGTRKPLWGKSHPRTVKGVGRRGLVVFDNWHWPWGRRWLWKDVWGSDPAYIWCMIWLSVQLASLSTETIWDPAGLRPVGQLIQNWHELTKINSGSIAGPREVEMPSKRSDRSVSVMVCGCLRLFSLNAVESWPWQRREASACWHILDTFGTFELGRTNQASYWVCRQGARFAYIYNYVYIYI